MPYDETIKGMLDKLWDEGYAAGYKSASEDYVEQLKAANERITNLMKGEQS